MRRLRALTALVLLLLGMAACSDDEPDPRDPSSTWSPTGTMEAPSSTATAVPTEPPLPDAARQASEEGARAFIAYYWELVNYAQVTGDVKALRAVSAKTCDVCRGVAKDLGELYRSGGYIIGGVNIITVKEAAGLTTDDNMASGYRLELDVTHDAQTIVRASGEQEARSAGSDSFSAYVLWVEERSWRTDVLDLH